MQTENGVLSINGARWDLDTAAVSPPLQSPTAPPPVLEHKKRTNTSSFTPVAHARRPRRDRRAAPFPADGGRRGAAQLSTALHALRDGLATRGAVAHTRRQAKVWCGELRAAGVEEKLVRRAVGVVVGIVLGKGLTVVEPADWRWIALL